MVSLVIINNQTHVQHRTRLSSCTMLYLTNSKFLVRWWKGTIRKGIIKVPIYMACVYIYMMCELFVRLCKQNKYIIHVMMLLYVPCEKSNIFIGSCYPRVLCWRILYEPMNAESNIWRLFFTMFTVNIIQIYRPHQIKVYTSTRNGNGGKWPAMDLPYWMNTNKFNLIVYARARL